PVMYFFFSSRRRHTRCLSDWSSDVCSSDLAASWPGSSGAAHGAYRRGHAPNGHGPAGPARAVRRGREPVRPLRALPGLLPHVRRSEEHTSELQSLRHLVCRLLLEKKKKHIF